MEIKEVLVEEIAPGSVVLVDDAVATKRVTSYYPDMGVRGVGVFMGVDHLSKLATYPSQVPIAMEKENFSNAYINVVKGDTLKVVGGEDKLLIIGKAMRAFQDGKFELKGFADLHTGSDPEFFVADAGGKLIPAWEFLPTKAEDTGVFWDGFQAEITPKARRCLVEHGNYIQGGIRTVMELARKKFPGAKIVNYSTVPVDLAVLARAEEKYVAFGCKPSINVYGEQEPHRDDPRLVPMRWAGGHLHAGVSNLFPASINPIVYALDAVLGVAAVGMAQKLDDPIRRQYYGRAGEIRLPKHGLEYRVLSNFWLTHPAITHVVQELFRASFKFGLSGWHQYIWKTPQDEVRRIINEGDVKAAVTSIKRNKECLKGLFAQMNFTCAQEDKSGMCFKYAMKAIEHGIESVVPSMDVAGNWNKEYIVKWTSTVNGGQHHSFIHNDGTGTEGAGWYSWASLAYQLEKGLVHPVVG